MRSKEHGSQETAREEAEGRTAPGMLALEMMHEVRNSLDALNNFLYLGLETPGGLEEVRRYIHLAQEQAATLNEITSSSLGFAKSSRSPKPTCLVSLAEAAVRIHKGVIEAKRIQLVKDLPDGLVAEVRGGEILQVVSNLVINALDALPSGGTLHVRLRRRADEAHLLIADNGNGIPKAISAQIFEPFFTTKEEAGTGLGLAFSKRIVEAHRGRIRLRSSVRPGKSGTLFKITLPLGEHRRGV
jgi:signal transduction histidine kinase